MPAPDPVIRPLICALSMYLLVFAMASGQTKSPRALPPDWSTTEESPFFEDAFRDGLTSERPGDFGKAATAAGADGTSGVNADSTDDFAWSRLASAATIEDQIKSLRTQLDKSVVQPAQYASGGHREARRQFALLAVLFFVIQEYDGEIRWKADAAAAGDRFRNLAAASDVVDAAAFQAAKTARLDLADLVGGNRWPQSMKAQPIKDWSTVADRRSLMVQLEQSLDEVIKPATASDRLFRAEKENMRRHAELTAVLSEILTRDDMEDAGDADYTAYCTQLQKAAQAVVAAIEDDNIQAAESSAGQMHKTCSDCHEDYRG